MLDWLQDNWKEYLEYGAWVVFYATLALNVVAVATKNKTDDKLVGWLGKGLKYLRKAMAMLALNVTVPPSLPPAEEE